MLSPSHAGAFCARTFEVKFAREALLDARTDGASTAVVADLQRKLDERTRAMFAARSRMLAS